MFRIRRIYDAVLPGNKESIRQVQEILRAQFADLTPEDVDAIGGNLRDPFVRRFRTILYVAETGGRRVDGFAYVLHDPKLKFCYLEYLASGKGSVSRGLGSALYEVIREEAAVLGARGLFFECLPDDPAEGVAEAVLKQNRARLRFYERYGARPLEIPGYQTPINPGDTGLPVLVYDGLDDAAGPRRAFVKQVVRAVLERKYGDLCSPRYVQTVVQSIRQDPVAVRPFRYTKAVVQVPARKGVRSPIVLVWNDTHQIHHITERGYVEAPVRIPRILDELQRTGLFATMKPKEYGLQFIKAVHNHAFVEYLRRTCATVPAGKAVYPYVFPVRNETRPPKELAIRAGYFCIDTFTPINANAWPAAKAAVDCTLTAAHAVLDGERFAYALVRPPGHHAERRSFGGFCYFNNAAVAAQVLSQHGTVAMLDIDYHHGNGQEDIFYERDDVFTVSIHGHPSFAYPYFTGFADSLGVGAGEGYNLNLPQPERLDPGQYHKVLRRAIRAVLDFRPMFLVLCLGLDTAKGDPTGSWTLGARDFRGNGRMIGAMNLPTLVVQEGGYRTRTLGVNARHFFEGLMEGVAKV